MVTWGQVAVTLIAGSYLIGRKELPLAAKSCGRYVGRSIGAVLRAKNEYFEATKDSEIVKMQTELQKGLDELNQIRSELTNISSMKRPLRPVGTAPSAGPSAPAVAASTAFVATPMATTASRQSSINNVLASVDHTERAYEDVLEHAEDPDQARLALAELNMTKQNQFTAHIESIEGGADYVSSSLMDSILLKRVAASAPSPPPTTSSTTQ